MKAGKFLPVLLVTGSVARINNVLLVALFLVCTTFVSEGPVAYGLFIPKFHPSSDHVISFTDNAKAQSAPSDPMNSFDASVKLVDTRDFGETPKVPNKTQPGRLRRRNSSSNNDGGPDYGSISRDTIIPPGPISLPDDLSEDLEDHVEVLFICNFEKHKCGMRHQKNIGRHFKLEAKELGNRPGRYMAVRARKVGYTLSRLITPYLPVRSNATACVSVMYFLDGKGARSIRVMAQDTTSYPLFELCEKGPGWKIFQYNMDAHQDVRFFIEAYTMSRAYGVIAIDNFQFSLTPCQITETNGNKTC